MRPEKIHEIEISLAPNFMTGQVVEVEREPFIIIGIAHRLDGFPTSKLRVVEPNWRWKLQYKARRLFRHVWRIITGPLRRLRERARRG